MNILCKTKEELKKVLEKLENSGHTWRDGDPCVEWGMENINDFPAVIIHEKVITWDYDFDDYKDSVTAAQFLADADLNTEKEGEATGKKLIDNAEFDKVAKKAIDEVAADPDFNFAAKLIVPMIGAMFALKMKIILFGEADE